MPNDERQLVIRDMFNRIAPSYDILNRFLSFGIDQSWRKAVAEELTTPQYQKILDTATGSCDLLLQIYKIKMKAGQKTEIYGLDLSRGLLQQAQHKINKKGLNDILLEGNAVFMPFKTSSFDAVTIAFGIRNVPEYKEALKEFARILKPQGRLIILEFSMPQNKLIKSLYLFYFRYVLPFFGGIFSGNKPAYQYLNTSAEKFPYGNEFAEIIINSGFKKIKVKPVTFGIATIYTADK